MAETGVLRRIASKILLKLGRKDVVLCADDDENIRTLCAAAAEKAGLVADLASNGREALDKIAQRHYAAVFLDLSMPYLHGATVLSLLRKNHPEVLQRVVVITGAPDAALEGGIVDDVRAVARKPVSVATLTQLLRGCIEDEANAPDPVPGDSVTVNLHGVRSRKSL